MDTEDIIELTKAYSTPFQKYVRFIEDNQYPNQIMRYLNNEVHPDDIRTIASDMMNMLWGIFVSEIEKTNLVKLKSVDELIGDVRPLLLFYHHWTIPMVKGVLDKCVSGKELTLTPDVEFKEMMWFYHLLDEPTKYSLSGFSSDGSSHIQVHINKPDEEPTLADEEVALYVLKAWLSDRRICEIDDVPSSFELMNSLDKMGRGEKFFKFLEMIRDATPHDDDYRKEEKNKYLEAVKYYTKDRQEDELNRMYYRDVARRVWEYTERIERIINDPTASILLVEDYMLRDFKEYTLMGYGWRSLFHDIFNDVIIPLTFEAIGEFRPFKVSDGTEWYTRLLK